MGWLPKLRRLRVALAVTAVAGLVAAGLLLAQYLRTPRRFGEVGPGALYRSAQPNGWEWSVLSRYGIRTVVNLCQEGELPGAFEEEREACRDEGVAVVHIPVATLLPTELQVEEFLRVARSGAPALVHCKEGRNRTGYMVAAYRVVVQGRSAQEACDEMFRLGATDSDNKRSLALETLQRFERGREERLARTAQGPAPRPAAASGPS